VPNVRRGEEERGLGIWFNDGIESIMLAIDEANLYMISRKIP
jgi:hypothetical protein